MISAGDAPLPFVLEFFTSPVSLVLLGLLALTILSQTRFLGNDHRHRQSVPEAMPE